MRQPVPNVVVLDGTSQMTALGECVIELGGAQKLAFLRGDGNADGNVNISDAVFTLEWLFAGGPEPGCIAALNTNGDAEVNITDPVSILQFLFAGEIEPVAPFPDCGPGVLPADEQLGCADPPDCA